MELIIEHGVQKIRPAPEEYDPANFDHSIWFRCECCGEWHEVKHLDDTIFCQCGITVTSLTANDIKY